MLKKNELIEDSDTQLGQTVRHSRLLNDSKWQVRLMTHMQSHKFYGKVTRYDIYWEYKDGYFNPWILKEEMRLYLKSFGMDFEGTYSEAEYNIKIADDCNIQVVSLSYEVGSEDLSAFNRLIEIIEKFLINGYESMDKALHERIVKEWTPVKTKSSLLPAADRYLYYFYNAAGVEIACLLDSGCGLKEGDVYAFSQAIRKIT